MEQNLYNKIILNLLKGESHLRQVAKKLKVNHMSVKRALDFLLKENAVDVKEEGRNNVFSIKKTLEAKNFVFTAEIHKFNAFIRRHSKLRQSIVDLTNLPESMVIIFGSYASGTETEDSDIDIYIEAERNSAEKINEKFSVKTGKYNKESSLIKEIERNHVIAKGVEEFYEKNRFFG